MLSVLRSSFCLAVLAKARPPKFPCEKNGASSLKCVPTSPDCSQVDFSRVIADPLEWASRSSSKFPPMEPAPPATNAVGVMQCEWALSLLFWMPLR